MVGDQRTQAELDFILDQLNLPPSAKVLYLCCRHERHSPDLAQRSSQLTGQDLSPVSLQKAAFPTMDQFSWSFTFLSKLPRDYCGKPAMIILSKLPLNLQIERQWISLVHRMKYSGGQDLQQLPINLG